MDRFDPFVKYADVYGDIINWEKDPMNKPQNQNKYFFSDGKTYYEQICKMLRLMSVFKEAFNQIYSNEDEISEAWENFVNNLSASVVEGSEPDVTLTWTDDSVNFEFTMVPGVPGEQGVGITSISFNSDYTMTITLSDGNTYTSMSLKGETGPQGPQGETGSGLQILDVYATLADLQSAHPTGQPGDAYQVGSAGNYTLYIWSSSQSAWVQAGTLGTVSPYTSAPLMDGTASAGSQNLYARGDHVHPSDTSRASKAELNALIKTSQALIDQSFTYRESPAIQDGLARIDKIKGNTLLWNQIVKANASSRYMNISDGVVTLTGTPAGNFDFMENTITHDQSHVYLFLENTIANPNNIELTLGMSSGQPWVSDFGTLGSHSRIYRSSYTTKLGFYSVANKDITGIKFTCNIFDLTVMFGTGNEPSTVEEFTSLFPLPYYDFNQGTLLSFNGNGIKTVGFNLFDEQFEQGNISNTGELVPATSNVRSVNYNSILPNTRYYCKVSSNVSLTSWFIAEYDGSMNFINRATITNGEITTKSNTRYFKLMLYYANGNLVPSDITECCLNIFDSEKNGTFEPYTTQTTNLPISTYFPTGMKSAGSVYDELTPAKATTRISRVDLGSLVWALRDNAYWQTQSDAIPDAKKPSDNVQPINAIHSIYEVKGGYYVQGVNQIGMTTTGVLNCNNGSTTDKPSGYLYYELATPVETAVDPDLSFNAYENGTEQLLPVNGSVPSTSPIIADITYLSIDDAMEYVLEKLANVPQNTQQILESLEDDVADLQTDTSALQTNVSSLQTSVGNINTNIGQLSSTVAGHTASISDMQSDISDLSTGLDNLEDTVTDNTSRIGTLETDLANTDGQVQNLATSVSGLDSTVTAQGETVTALDNFVSNIANTRNPGYMSSDNSIGITSAFLNMTLAAGQSAWANIPLPTIMAGFIPLFVVGAATGDGSVCLFKIPSTYNQNNIYRVGVKNTSNSEVTTQVSIEILCIKQRQSQ